MLTLIFESALTDSTTSSTHPSLRIELDKVCNARGDIIGRYQGCQWIVRGRVFPRMHVAGALTVELQDSTDHERESLGYADSVSFLGPVLWVNGKRTAVFDGLFWHSPTTGRNWQEVALCAAEPQPVSVS